MFYFSRSYFTEIGLPFIVFVVVSITETLFRVEIVTYILLFTRSYSMWLDVVFTGLSPTEIGLLIFLVCSSINYGDIIRKMSKIHLIFTGSYSMSPIPIPVFTDALIGPSFVLF